MRGRRKTETRRRRETWRALQPGDRLLAVEKAQGLKRGETQTVIGVIEVTANDELPLSAITPRGVVEEGFPHMTPAAFVAMFYREFGVAPDAIVRRIRFRHVEEI